MAATRQSKIARFRREQDPGTAELQCLIDGGVWGLEGSIGRAMMAAIRNGECILGPEPARDYWGGRIPAEHEVERGTPGSIEYALSAGDN